MEPRKIDFYDELIDLQNARNILRSKGFPYTTVMRYGAGAENITNAEPSIIISRLSKDAKETARTILGTPKDFELIRSAFPKAYRIQAELFRAGIIRLKPKGDYVVVVPTEKAKLLTTKDFEPTRSRKRQGRFEPVDQFGKVESLYEKLERRTEEQRRHYAPLFGRRITFHVGRHEPTTYELVDVNDLGIPYWAKVVHGKKQKTQFTLATYSKDWLDEEMAKLPEAKSRIPKPRPSWSTEGLRLYESRDSESRRPLPPDAQNVQELSFNSDQFTCYGKPTGRGFRAYCRRK